VAIYMAHRRARTNPFTSLLADAIEPAAGEPVLDYRMRDFLLPRRGDVVHLHWFSSLFHGRTKAGTVARSLILDLYFLALRARGVRLFWTVNNLVAHEADYPELELKIIKRLARRFDGLFAFGEETARRLETELGAPPERVSVVPHPSYRDHYPRAGLPPVRERYGFGEGPIHLFFGLLRPYKGLENLIEAFNDGKRNLLVVGGGDQDYAARLKAANRSPRTVIDARRVPDEEVASLFESADRVVLPFSRITMSGSMVCALSYGKFVVSVADGDVPSYVLDGANGYLMPDNSPDSIRAALARTDLLPEPERRAWTERVERMIRPEEVGRAAAAAYRAAAERNNA